MIHYVSKCTKVVWKVYKRTVYPAFTGFTCTKQVESHNVAEIRGYIKAGCKKGVKSIHDEICVVYEDKQMSFSTVYRWFTKFSSGQESVKDAPYSGRPRSAVTQCNINKIKSIIKKRYVFHCQTAGINETRGPWWSYIAHLTKQICIFTVEVSAKFTVLGFLYKLYSTNHPHPLHHTPAMFFLQILTTWTES